MGTPVFIILSCNRRTATLEDRMHHLETLIQAIPPAVFAAGSGPPLIPTTSEPASSPSASFIYPAGLPLASGVPPPSLHVFPLMNPSTHFTRDPERHHSPSASFGSLLGTPYPHQVYSPDQLAEETSRMSLTASYLYFDDEGYTRWQGETSGLPVLDLLVERHTPASNRENPDSTRSDSASTNNTPSAPTVDWFPNRTPRRTDVNPQTLWRLITSYIVPELMDR